jgi:DNA-binding response OmpR family regulator/HPt (histidine-containing phosphotransfer) domain-containing protein
MNDDEQIMEDKMRALRVNYLRSLGERVEKIKHFVMLQEQKTLRPEDSAELQSLAHKLSGTGATYGFPTISETAASLEDWLIDHPEERGRALDLTRRLHDACRMVLESSSVDGVETQAVVHSPRPLALDAPLLLIVDDDKNVRDTLTQLFSEDARIMTAVNTTEALELMEKHQPNLVLLDDMMPGGVSGLRMLEKRQSMHDIKNIPVIMITASKRVEEMLRGMRAGAVDYIAKPFNSEDVVARIQPRLRRMSARILIVDNDEEIRDVLGLKFHQAGLRSIGVENGDEAWEILQRQRITLAIFDRMMPGLNGMSLLQKMKEATHLTDIPVIFLTARRDKADVEAGLRQGAIEYITKPFRSDDVVIRCLQLLKLSNPPRPWRDIEKPVAQEADI